MRMWIFPVGALLTLLGLARKKAQEPTMSISYSVRIWEPVVLPFVSLATPPIPLAFAMGWIQKESGGNPCAWGTATAKGPDGHPREQGIGQFYNPDDMQRFNIKPGAFRVYCVPGKNVCSRALTPDEMRAQAETLVKMIIRDRDVAEEVMRKSGVTWSPTSRDYWKLVKLVHGLPGLVKQGIPRVTVALKRPPRDWLEYKTAILAGLKMDTGTERYRPRFAALFANAEGVASALPVESKGEV